MKFRVDFALIDDGGKILAELSAAGDTLEAAIFGATVTAAPHVADGRSLVILRAGYLCRCGAYHAISQVVEAADAQHAELKSGGAEATN